MSKKNKPRAGAKGVTGKRLTGRKLSNACEQLLGVAVIGQEFPGGKSRRSCRILLADGRSAIATQRPPHRADLEISVLQALAPSAAPVPALLGCEGRLMIQQDIPGQRLSAALHDAGQDPDKVEPLLDRSLASLVEIHQAGSGAGLDDAVPTLGDSDDWLRGLLRRPAVIGRYFQHSAPRPQLDQLRQLLRPRRPRFIKWDARPGNAILDDNGRVVWFDWEHGGARNRLDDMAWLLCDEFVADLPEVETGLIDRHLDGFSDVFEVDEARHYLYAYGVFHSAVRLGLILDNKGDEPWWDLGYCITGDKVGVTLECARRVCLRAARWAARTPQTEALAPWFEQISERVERL